jgi:hypothetical protein
MYQLKSLTKYTSGIIISQGFCYEKEAIMQIPEKIKIGGFTVDVEFVENLMLEDNHRGEYSLRTQIIKIDKATTKQSIEETFIHEMLEAMTNIYDIDIAHKDLSNLATVLHQVIKDNPEVFKTE